MDLTRKDRFAVKYGRIEVRAQVPSGVGTWPTMWALGDVEDPWPTSGEIDVLEAAGRVPDTVIGTIHGPRVEGADNADEQFYMQTTTRTEQPLSAGFHTFGVVWTPDRFTWFLDDKPYGVITRDDADQYGDWAWDHPFYLILNLAIGGLYGGDVPTDATYPQRLLVDWVRVYQ